jgi:hypothetical protein
MANRKSIAKVQLGSITPEKPSVQVSDVTLPQINGGGSAGHFDPSEIRSAEKPTATKPTGGARPSRPSILHKPTPAHGAAKAAEDATSAHAVGKSTKVNHTDKAAIGEGSIRISRPSILNKQPIGKSSDSEKAPNGHRKNSADKAHVGVHSPSVPTDPKASNNRVARASVLKHLPKGETSTKTGLCCCYNKLVTNFSHQTLFYTQCRWLFIQKKQKNPI